ncbi:unnamed protein product [Mytilus coruscus]|uniref:CCHC-type domain-containing protein n=1 Tax=Mytilus coruscus TaxID=42192 RepID=A0A6J8CW42_MYTCO|nr:unnamed protein product [Mytilus coruscus]
MSRIKNDPSFFYETTNQHDKTSRTLPRSTADRSFISTRKTDVLPNSDLNNNSVEKKCSFHKTDGHTLNNCRAFKATSIIERRKLLKENGICFRCCGTSNHMKKDCKERIKCSDCGSKRHATALHIEKVTQFSPVSNHGGEIGKTDADVSSACTQICDILTRKDVDKGTSTQHIIPDFPLENTDTDKRDKAISFS